MAKKFQLNPGGGPGNLLPGLTPLGPGVTDPHGIDPNKYLPGNTKPVRERYKPKPGDFGPGGPAPIPGQTTDPGNTPPWGDWKEEWWHKYTKPPKEVEPFMPYIPMPSFENRGPDGRPLRNPIHWFKWSIPH